MKKLISIMLLLLMITPCLRAQRKELSQARSYLKSGRKQEKTDKRINDYKNAEELMTGLLKKDSANKTNHKIYLLWYQAVEKQFETANEQLYLKQKYDTAQLFNLNKTMFSILESLDSIDAETTNNGVVKTKYRDRHSEILNGLRPNLYYGGTYNINKNNFKEAFSFFEMYLDCAKQPIFTSYNYQKTDSRMPEAAYWASYCGFKLNDADKTLKYLETARLDTARLKYTLRYAADAYMQKKDETKCLEILHEGFDKFPRFTYFFPRLMDYYTKHNKLDKALDIANRALTVSPTSELFLYAKSTVLLNMGKYKESIAICDSLISINDTLPEPYFNAGTAFLNLAISAEFKDNSAKGRKSIKKIYQQALPYMEKYRKLAPSEKRKWGPPLYKIYLYLNLGQQFEEMDKVLDGI